MIDFLERIRWKRRAYRAIFLVDGKPGPMAAVVLADLRKFCRIGQGGIVVSPLSRMTDPYATVYQAGLRDAYQRIIMMSGLDPGEEQIDGRAEPANTDAAA
jgi:hypothetical protein